MTAEEGPQDVDVKSTADMFMLVMRALLELEPRMLRVAAVLEEAHAVGPIIDPTAYRDFLQRPGGNMDDVVRVFRAVRPGIEEFRRISGRAMADGRQA